MKNHTIPRQKEYDQFLDEAAMDFVEPTSQVLPIWSPEQLLSQEGLFPLEAVAASLNMSTSKIKVEADHLKRAGGSPVDEMGVRKTATGWVVDMVRFRPFYLEKAMKWVRRVNPHWDGNQMLSQKGVFFLAEVCETLPFRPGMIRSQVNRAEDSRQTMGVWKDENHNTYVVDMEVFAPWIKEVWKQARS